MRFLRRKQVWLVQWALSALMETSVLLPWAILLLALGGAKVVAGAPGFGVLLGVYAAAGLVEGSGLHKGTERRRSGARLVAAMAGTAAAYAWAYLTLPPDLAGDGPLSLNPALAVLPVAWIAWGRGSDAVAGGLDYYTVYASFRLRSLILVGAVMALVFTGNSGGANLLLYWSVILFFASGLSLLLLARRIQVRKEQAGAGDPAAGTDSPALTWVVIGLVAISLLTAQVLSVDRLLSVLDSLSHMASPVWSWLVDVLMLLLYPYLVILFYVMEGFRRLFPKRPAQQRAPEQQQGPELPTADIPTAQEVAQRSSEWVQWVAVAILAAVLFWWMWRRARQRAEEEAGDLDEIRENLGFWAQLWRDLAGLLRLLTRKLSAERAATLSGTGDPEDMMDPRALFRRLQRWGAGRGRPRKPSETPTQYQDALVKRTGSQESGLGLLVRLYNRARYGPEQPAQHEVDQGRSALLQLEEKAEYPGMRK